jgi:hypothetical protein
MVVAGVPGRMVEDGAIDQQFSKVAALPKSKHISGH